MRIEFSIDKDEKDTIMNTATQIAVTLDYDPREIAEEMSSLGSSYVHEDAYGTLHIETFPNGNVVAKYATAQEFTKDCASLTVDIVKDCMPLVSLVKSAIILYRNITSRVSERIESMFAKYNAPISTVECYDVTVGGEVRKAVVTKDKFDNIHEVIWDGCCPIKTVGISLKEFFAEITPVKHNFASGNTKFEMDEIEEIKNDFLNTDK